MDLRKLKTLIDLVQQSGIAELEITEGEERVRISRAGAHAAAAPPYARRRHAAQSLPLRLRRRGEPLRNPRCPRAMSSSRPWSARSIGRRRLARSLSSMSGRP